MSWETQWVSIRPGPRLRSSVAGATRPPMYCPDSSTVVWRLRRSDPLDDRGNPHPPADAQRGEAAAQVPALELVDERAEDHRAGGAQRVAHGDRAAVDVGDV